MTDDKLTTADYPLAERRPDLVEGPRGKHLDEITLDAVIAGDVGIEDLRITADALMKQAAIARDAGRPMLAGNLERASELVAVPQDVVMRVYELLRPGRAADRATLEDAAAMLRATYGAERMARFVEEAADVYARRGLFRKRF
ncbi:MAG: diol dehydratase small subunit [Hyphomicrobiaceae bacterium]